MLGLGFHALLNNNSFPYKKENMRIRENMEKYFYLLMCISMLQMSSIYRKIE